MKITKINILALAFGGMIAFSGCGKDDGAIPSRIGIEDVPTLSTSIDPTGSQAISM